MVGGRLRRMAVRRVIGHLGILLAGGMGAGDDTEGRACQEEKGQGEANELQTDDRIVANAPVLIRDNVPAVKSGGPQINLSWAILRRTVVV